MAIIYSIWGQNEEKEWPIVSYIDLTSVKKHLNKLNEVIQKRKEFIERSKEDYTEDKEEEKNIYDNSGNVADSYYVIKSMSFMTFDGFKAYNGIPL